MRIISAGQMEVAEIESPNPVAGEVVIALKAAALNHRDLWIKLGRYPGISYPIVPGSDGTGTVVAIGADIDESWLGREVVVNPGFDWGDNLKVQSERFTILGLPRQGTFAEQIRVPVAQIAPKPQRLSHSEAAALPLAGLTAWRTLFTRAELQAGQRVLITGIGGGVALFALQFAAAAGIEAWVTSSSDSKIARARKLGAEGGFNYTLPGWSEEAVRAVPTRFDAVVDGAGGDGLSALLDICAAGGRLVTYGATRGNPPDLPLRKVFSRQITVCGSMLGSPMEFSQMLDFVARHRIRPVLSEEFPLERAGDALALMERGDQYGKIVLRIA